MANKIPVTTVKQEYEEDSEEAAGTSDLPKKAQHKNIMELGDLKIPQSGKKSAAAGKLCDVKRIKKEPQALAGKEGNARKMTGPEVEASFEPPRVGIFPYRTKSDFCCTICNAHMNSIQMWESHIRGKRHLKNCKKGSVTSAPVKKEEVDDVAGLYYIDTQGSQSPPHSNILYERRPESPGDSRPKEYPIPEPLPPAAVAAAASASASAAAASSVDPRNLANLPLTMTERMDYIQQLSMSIFPQNESDIQEIKSIVAALTQSLIQYEIRQLPLAAQQKLAKELFKGN